MSEPFTVEVRPEAGCLRLYLAGNLDLSTVATLEVCLEQIDDDVRRVVLELGDLTFLDSAGLNCLVHTHQRFDPELRELLLSNPSPTVRRVLSVSGVDQLIPISDSPIERTAPADPV